MPSDNYEQLEATIMVATVAALIGVGLVLRLGPVVIAIAAALLLVLITDPDPLPVVVTSITLPGSVPCLVPFLLMANFRYVHVQ